MSEIEIVRLGAGDGERLRALRLAALADTPDAFGSTYEQSARQSPEEWARGAESIATFFAVVGGVDAGMARGAPDRYDADAAWLISMWVAPGARGRGVGDALVEAVIAWARDEGYRCVRLDVGDWNERAIALYARHGFEPTGVTGAFRAPREHITEHRRELDLERDRP